MIRLLVLLALLAPPKGLAASETPVVHDDMLKGNARIGDRPWRAPNYSDQAGALGWTPSAFAVPPGLERQVSFWLDIYTKYTANQGVLHDSEQIDFIYKELDFTDIEGNSTLNSFQKERARDKRVRTAKKEVVDRLTKLSKLDSSKGLSGEDLRYWRLFSKVKESDKFIKASKDGRLRFQLGQKDRIILGIYYAGRYIEDFEQIFKKEGLPKELTRMVFVESSFNIYAQSRVGASGLWQIMPFVGRNQLMMNAAVDERNHPWIATKLAAKILKQNYKMLEDWPLAITGYNHGAYGIKRLARKHNATGIVELLENAQTKGNFGFASRNFFASYLAVLEAERNAAKYYGQVVWSQPLPKTEFKLATAIKYEELLEWFGGDETLAKLFNPHISYNARKGRVPIPVKSTIYVHKKNAAQAKKALETFAQQKRRIFKPRSYRVSRGDTLIRIAKKFGVSVKTIMDSNELKKKNHIRVGQVLSIPQAD